MQEKLEKEYFNRKIQKLPLGSKFFNSATNNSWAAKRICKQRSCHLNLKKKIQVKKIRQFTNVE